MPIQRLDRKTFSAFVSAQRDRWQAKATEARRFIEALPDLPKE